MKASLDDECGRGEICKKHDVEGGEMRPRETSTVAEGKKTKTTEEGDQGRPVASREVK